MRKYLKKTLKNHFYQTVIIYLCCYLFYTFITWSLTNPFQWILDIPMKTINERVFILLFFLAYNGLGVFIRYDIAKYKQD